MTSDAGQSNGNEIEAHEMDSAHQVGGGQRGPQTVERRRRNPIEAVHEIAMLAQCNDDQPRCAKNDHDRLRDQPAAEEGAAPSAEPSQGQSNGNVRGNEWGNGDRQDIEPTGHPQRISDPP